MSKSQSVSTISYILDTPFVVHFEEAHWVHSQWHWQMFRAVVPDLLKSADH